MQFKNSFVKKRNVIVAHPQDIISLAHEWPIITTDTFSFRTKPYEVETHSNQFINSLNVLNCRLCEGSNVIEEYYPLYMSFPDPSPLPRKWWSRCQQKLGNSPLLLTNIPIIPLIHCPFMSHWHL